MTQNARKFHLGKDESDLLRTTQSKCFIAKGVVLAAVARPRWDSHRKCYFHEKLVFGYLSQKRFLNATAETDLLEQW